MNHEEQKQAIVDLLARNGVTMTAVFVPQSMSRNSAEKDRTLNWRLTLINSATKQTMTVDYSQGIGNVPGWVNPRTLHLEELMGKPWESGKYAVKPNSKLASYMVKRATLPAPSASDLLYSIVADSTEEFSCFEMWAAEFGYDTDSRKAEQTYEACKQQTRDAQRVLGRTVIEEAAVILRDY